MVCYHDHCYADLSITFILVQVGGFYEAIGFCALVLMHYCGVNPMSAGTGMALAGVPIANIRHLLAQLVDAGFSVVGEVMFQ